MRARLLRLAAPLAMYAGAALADVTESTEERFNEARAQPTPVAKSSNWVLVPIPVANPTVGNGLQLATLYLHPKRPGEEDSPAATSGLAAMATDAGARLLGVFHDSSLDHDRFRVSGFAGVGKFELRFYGVGADSAFTDHPVPYEMSGSLAQLRGEMRIPGSEHWFVGLTYQYLQTTLTVQASQVVAALPDVPIEFRNAALGLHVQYDSRDSNYFPLSGQRFRAAWMNYAPRWGGDFSFDKGDVFFNHYLQLGTASVLGLRARVQTASENTPFFALPTLDMRGFSRERYRDNDTLSLSAEWRHKIAPRWGVAAYAEAGRFAPSLHALSSARTITTYGGGIRWQVTADRDMHIGLDLAVSSDDRAVFVQIGERF